LANPTVLDNNEDNRVRAQLTPIEPVRFQFSGSCYHTHEYATSK